MASCNRIIDPIGPCVHTYEEPVLNILSISGDESTAITQANIYSISIDGNHRDPSFLIMESSNNVTISDTTLICTVPCGFGTASGQYQFTIVSEGYEPKSITVNADYEVFKGGCPSSNSKGTRINIGF